MYSTLGHLTWNIGVIQERNVSYVSNHVFNDLLKLNKRKYINCPYGILNIRCFFFFNYFLCLRKRHLIEREKHFTFEIKCHFLPVQISLNFQYFQYVLSSEFNINRILFSETMCKFTMRIIRTMSVSLLFLLRRCTSISCETQPKEILR